MPATLTRGLPTGDLPPIRCDVTCHRALLTRSLDLAEQLTGRERQVLSLVAAGLSNEQIAVRLGIVEGTVKAHLTNAYKRIGLADRTQAARWARRHGLADDNS